MSLLSFVQSLPNVLERRQVMNVVDQLKLEYDDTISPILDDVRETYQGKQLKSILNKRMDTVTRRFVSFNGDSLTLILNNLTNIRGYFELLERDVKSAFSVQFTNTNMSFERANVLRFIEALAFYIRYARKYLLFLTAQESATIGKSTAGKWSAAEIEWVDSHMVTFAELYQTMAIQPNEFKARIQRTSNAVIDESTYQVAMQSLGAQKTDPFQMDGFSPRQNPFMMLGKFLAEMQVTRYNEAKEEFYGLQLRLQELRDLSDGQPANPKVQKLIQDYEKRISEYEYELKQIEEKAGLA